MDLEPVNAETRWNVRVLRASDLDRLVRIDQARTGRGRRVWLASRLERALRESDVVLSLGAEADGHLVGALMGTVQYGEFGRPEPEAVLDTILVDPAYGRRGVGRALIDQLVHNLRGLRIERIRTEVHWSEQDLIGFLARSGFAPAPRLVLEMNISS